MMEPNLTHIIEQVGKDKGLPKEVIIQALEAAMLTAARKKLGQNRELEAHFNEEIGEVEVFEFRTVVEQDADKDTQIILEEARQLDPEVQIGDSMGMKLDSAQFGRIAAQTAKQVIIQRVRDAERDTIYNEYKERVGELVTGIARKFEKGSAIIVDLGRAEAVLPAKEQAPRENYRLGDRIQAYVVLVDKQLKGPQIVLSRVHPGLLIKLFELEVPEIAEGIVRIESAAREPGGRAKIAVSSRDRDVDPVGACVGIKGSRVQAVVQELRGEKIDIVPYHDDPARFVCNALAPAEVSRVVIDEANHSMEIIVPDDQLSLAIGRKGQNVRLATQLTGWKLDILSEAKASEIRQQALAQLSRVRGLNDATMEQFFRVGFRRAEEVADAKAEDIMAAIPTLTPEQVTIIQASATDVAEQIALEEALAKEAADAAKSAAPKPAPAPETAAPATPATPAEEGN